MIIDCDSSPNHSHTPTCFGSPVFLVLLARHHRVLGLGQEKSYPDFNVLDWAQYRNNANERNSP